MYLNKEEAKEAKVRNENLGLLLLICGVRVASSRFETFAKKARAIESLSGGG